MSLSFLSQSRVLSVLLLAAALAALPGCDGAPPAGPGGVAGAAPAAVYPAYQPGAPVPGGLQIVSAVAAPDPFAGIYKSGFVTVFFNGAATQPGRVQADAILPGWTIRRSVGSANYPAGATSVKIPVGFWSDQTGPQGITLTIVGTPSSVFQTYVNVKGK